MPAGADAKNRLERHFTCEGGSDTGQYLDLYFQTVPRTFLIICRGLNKNSNIFLSLRHETPDRSDYTPVKITARVTEI